MEQSPFTITEPLEVGSLTLQPGTYVIRLDVLEPSRHIVQVTNVEWTTVLAAVLADPRVLGRIEIPRIGITAMVREGDDEATLAVAVGQFPGDGAARRAVRHGPCSELL